MAVAEYSLHLKLLEGSTNGDFGELYPDYRWQLDTREVLTNGLFQVDVTVYHQSQPFSTMSILLFRPDSPKSF
jgi:hypothetical protein